MATYYPPVGFHFAVEIPGLAARAEDARFGEVGGLGLEMSTEEVPEGGQNRFVQRFPVRARHPNLTLKRGLLVGSDILNWARRCIEDFDIEPMEMTVTLLDEEHAPLMVWQITGAYPTKWSASDLNATNNAVVVESLELFYQSFRVSLPDRAPTRS